jgi:hypothetical protein
VKDGPIAPTRNSTTSFLTATTLIYAIGAGITAAAGTRLALQLILDKGFKLFSFQFQNAKHLESLFLVTTSLELGLGNLRACCLPWMWSPFLRRPLRYQTPIPRYPLMSWLSNTQPSKTDRAETQLIHRFLQNDPHSYYDSTLKLVSI